MKLRRAAANCWTRSNSDRRSRISRSGETRVEEWTLTEPTFGAPNLPVSLASPDQLRINEWLADNEVSLNNDFIELYNPLPGPVDIGGFFLTDNPVGWPDRHQLAPLTYVGAGGHTRLVADGDPEDGADHVDFRLSRVKEMIGLFDESGNAVDVVRYGPQHPDVSVGFSPDGSQTLAAFRVPTPGLRNEQQAIATYHNCRL